MLEDDYVESLLELESRNKDRIPSHGKEHYFRPSIELIFLVLAVFWEKKSSYLGNAIHSDHGLADIVIHVFIDFNLLKH